MNRSTIAVLAAAVIATHLALPASQPKAAAASNNPTVIAVHGLAESVCDWTGPEGAFGEAFALLATDPNAGILSVQRRNEVYLKAMQLDPALSVPDCLWDADRGPLLLTHPDDTAIGGLSQSDPRLIADRLASLVGAAAADSPTGTVNLLGYSLGGLTIRTFVARHPELAHHIDRVLIVNGVNEGAWPAAVAAEARKYVEREEATSLTTADRILLAADNVMGADRSEIGGCINIFLEATLSDETDALMYCNAAFRITAALTNVSQSTLAAHDGWTSRLWTDAVTAMDPSHDIFEQNASADWAGINVFNLVTQQRVQRKTRHELSLPGLKSGMQIDYQVGDSHRWVGDHVLAGSPPDSSWLGSQRFNRRTAATAASFRELTYLSECEYPVGIASSLWHEGRDLGARILGTVASGYGQTSVLLAGGTNDEVRERGRESYDRMRTFGHGTLTVGGAIVRSKLRNADDAAVEGGLPSRSSAILDYFEEGFDVRGVEPQRFYTLTDAALDTGRADLLGALPGSAAAQLDLRAWATSNDVGRSVVAGADGLAAADLVGEKANLVVSGLDVLTSELQASGADMTTVLPVLAVLSGYAGCLASDGMHTAVPYARESADTYVAAHLNDAEARRIFGNPGGDVPEFEDLLDESIGLPATGPQSLQARVAAVLAIGTRTADGNEALDRFAQSPGRCDPTFPVNAMWAGLVQDLGEHQTTMHSRIYCPSPADGVQWERWVTTDFNGRVVRTTDAETVLSQVDWPLSRVTEGVCGRGGPATTHMSTQFGWTGAVPEVGEHYAMMRGCGEGTVQAAGIRSGAILAVASGAHASAVDAGTWLPAPPVTPTGVQRHPDPELPEAPPPPMLGDKGFEVAWENLPWTYTCMPDGDVGPLERTDSVFGSWALQGDLASMFVDLDSPIFADVTGDGVPDASFAALCGWPDGPAPTILIWTTESGQPVQLEAFADVPGHSPRLQSLSEEGGTLWAEVVYFEDGQDEFFDEPAGQARLPLAVPEATAYTRTSEAVSALHALYAARSAGRWSESWDYYSSDVREHCSFENMVDSHTNGSRVGTQYAVADIRLTVTPSGDAYNASFDLLSSRDGETQTMSHGALIVQEDDGWRVDARYCDGWSN